MLQELTENDFKYIPTGMSQKNLSMIYNFFIAHCNPDIIQNFIFEDKFNADCYSMKINKDLKLEMKTWKDYSYFTYIDKRSVFNYRDPISEEHLLLLKQEYPFFKGVSKNRIEHYVRVIYTKLRPTEEFYKNYLEEKWKNSFQKEQAEILEREKIRQASISEEEREGNKIADYIAEQKINEKKNYNYKKVANAFIYGIYIDNKLVYIGKTTREMKNRLGEHLEYTLLGEGGGSQQNYLYKAMRECEVGYKFKILYESYNTISNHELEEIEKTLIENIQPEFNYEGVKVPYRFSEEKR